MAVTLEQVRQLLEAEEPDAKFVARLGPQIVPHLKTLITGADSELAVKAAYVATLINDDSAVELLKEAARSPSPLVRVAVASGLRNVTRPGGTAVMMALLDDRDTGVRKLAIKASAASGNPTVLAKLDALSRSDPSPALRTLASKSVTDARGRRTA